MIIYIIPSGIDKTDAQKLINYTPEYEHVTMTLDEFPEYEHSLSTLNEEVTLIIVETKMFKLAKPIAAKLDPVSKCWVCNSHASNPAGYKRFSRNNTNESTHRYVYKYFNSDPGDSNDVCHSCNNRSCINPFHLSADTHAENMAYMVAQDRQARGETHGSAILTNNDVVAILADDIFTNKELALKFGVCDETIRSIKKGLTWVHINRNDITRVSGRAV
jgi:hypothetical protein